MGAEIDKDTAFLAEIVAPHWYDRKKPIEWSAIINGRFGPFPVKIGPAMQASALINIYRRQLARIYPETLLSPIRNEELTVQLNDNVDSTAMNTVFHELSPRIMHYLDEKDFAGFASHERNLRLCHIKKKLFDEFITKYLNSLREDLDKGVGREIAEFLELALRQGYALPLPVVQSTCASAMQEFSEDWDTNIARPACPPFALEGQALEDWDADIAGPACPSFALEGQALEDWDADITGPACPSFALEGQVLLEGQQTDGAYGSAAVSGFQATGLAIAQDQEGEVAQEMLDQETDQPLAEELRVRRTAALDKEKK